MKLSKLGCTLVSLETLGESRCWVMWYLCWEGLGCSRAFLGAVSLARALKGEEERRWYSLACWGRTGMTAKNACRGGEPAMSPHKRALAFGTVLVPLGPLQPSTLLEP